MSRHQKKTKPIKASGNLYHNKDLNRDSGQNTPPEPVKLANHTVDGFVKGIREGNRSILSKALTLIESRHPSHTKMAQEVLEACVPFSGRSFRIGITGSPGVGKSTLIDALGTELIQRGHKIAVLAIDPSSSISKGSILADKTRMESLLTKENAFIRPTPSSCNLGGVAHTTRESVILCEAAGFDRILIETVGVGQSEYAVYQMVDFFLLLLLAGAGDELQGIKRGIIEMSDGLAITKADGDNLIKAQMAKTQYQKALELFQLSASGTGTWVETVSAISNSGINRIISLITEYEQKVKQNGYFEKRRLEQQKKSLDDTIQMLLVKDFYSAGTVLKLRANVLDLLDNQKITPQQAALKLLHAYYKRFGRYDE